MTRTGSRQHHPDPEHPMRSVIVTSAAPTAVIRCSRVSRSALWGTVVLAMATLAACGKSSGGAGSSGAGEGNPSPPGLSGDSAIKAVVVSGYQAFQGGPSYPLPQVEATLPASSPLKPAVVAVVGRMVGRESSPTTSKKAATRAAATSRALTYDNTLGLYEAGFNLVGDYGYLVMLHQGVSTPASAIPSFPTRTG
jgi:hypothetical protein